MKIYPSLTSQNPTELQEQIEQFTPFVQGFHIDYMDGNFVPNTLGSVELINTIRALTTRPLWIHLMAYEPLAVIKQLRLSLQDRVTFHAESTKEYQPIITYLHQQGVQASLALNPKTSLHALAPFLYTIDHITIMSVQPGRSGQFFLESTWSKLKDLQALRAHQAHYFTIAVDGGVTTKNIHMLACYGVNEAAVSSAILDKKDSISALKQLQDTTESNKE